MAQPRKRTERMKGFNVNFPPSVWEALRRRAFEEHTTVSAQVRLAVERYLERKMKK